MTDEEIVKSNHPTAAVVRAGDCCYIGVVSELLDKPYLITPVSERFFSEEEAWADAAKDLRPVSDYERAFLDALKKDKYDSTTRLVYADWLDEQGEDDRAARQRHCATEEWIAADKWLSEFAEKITEPDYHDGGPYEKVTVEEVVEAGRLHVDEDEQSCLSGMGFGATNIWDEDDNDKNFWLYWQAHTGRYLDESQMGEPFRCCY